MPVENSAAELATWINDPLRQIVAHLAKNDMADAEGNLNLETLQECTFAGYNPITLENLVMDEDSGEDTAHAFADAAEWISGNVVAPETPSIVFYTHIYDGGTPVLLSWFPLDEIVAVDRAGIKITQIPEFWGADLS